MDDLRRLGQIRRHTEERSPQVFDLPRPHVPDDGVCQSLSFGKRDDRDRVVDDPREAFVDELGELVHRCVHRHQRTQRGTDRAPADEVDRDSQLVHGSSDAQVGEPAGTTPAEDERRCEAGQDATQAGQIRAGPLPDVDDLIRLPRLNRHPCSGWPFCLDRVQYDHDLRRLARGCREEPSDGVDGGGVGIRVDDGDRVVGLSGSSHRPLRCRPVAFAHEIRVFELGLVDQFGDTAVSGVSVFGLGDALSSEDGVYARCPEVTCRAERLDRVDQLRVEQPAVDVCCDTDRNRSLAVGLASIRRSSSEPGEHRDEGSGMLVHQPEESFDGNPYQTTVSRRNDAARPRFASEQAGLTHDLVSCDLPSEAHLAVDVGAPFQESPRNEEVSGIGGVADLVENIACPKRDPFHRLLEVGDDVRLEMAEETFEERQHVTAVEAFGRLCHDAIGEVGIGCE